MHTEYTKSTLEREWVLKFIFLESSAQLFIPNKKYVQPCKILQQKLYSIFVAAGCRLYTVPIETNSK